VLLLGSGITAQRPAAAWGRPIFELRNSSVANLTCYRIAERPCGQTIVNARRSVVSATSDTVHRRPRFARTGGKDAQRRRRPSGGPAERRPNAAAGRSNAARRIADEGPLRSRKGKTMNWTTQTLRLKSCALSPGVGVRTGMSVADLRQSFLDNLLCA